MTGLRVIHEHPEARAVLAAVTGERDRALDAVTTLEREHADVRRLVLLTSHGTEEAASDARAALTAWAEKQVRPAGRTFAVTRIASRVTRH